MQNRKNLAYLFVSVFSLAIIFSIYSTGIYVNRLANLEKQVDKNTLTIETLLTAKK